MTNSNDALRLALSAIKVIAATVKAPDVPKALAKIMAISRWAGIEAPYSELQNDGRVAFLLSNATRKEGKAMLNPPPVAGGDLREAGRSAIPRHVEFSGALKDADWEKALTETDRLTRELNITNADHIALWLEANVVDSPIGWLACRIVEAHEAALNQPAAPVEAELSYAGDGWKLRGYPSHAAEIEDMANVGRALMEAIEKDYSGHPFMQRWHPADCPTEIVGDLLNALDEARPAPVEAVERDEARIRHDERKRIIAQGCIHTRKAGEQADYDRPDVSAWQADQKEWFDPTICEIVSEYAAWRDAHPPEPAASTVAQGEG